MRGPGPYAGVVRSFFRYVMKNNLDNSTAVRLRYAFFSVYGRGSVKAREDNSFIDEGFKF